MTLKELAIDHDYYCSDNNYYSNEAAIKFETWSDFYDEYINADIDMNLIFRWDIKKRDESERYYCEVFMIHQRKGIFRPVMISYIDDKDVKSFIKLVSMHWKKLTSIWNPVSQPKALKLKT